MVRPRADASAMELSVSMRTPRVQSYKSMLYNTVAGRDSEFQVLK